MLLVVGLCLTVVLVIVYMMSRNPQPSTIRALPIGWKLLWLSGVSFVPGGLVWLLKCQPSPGPYIVGEVYPFGDHVQAWQVSMGFAFVAFGVLFPTSVILAAKTRERWALNGLLLGWLLLMFPHLLIGLAFVLGDPTLTSLGVARYAIPFTVVWLAMVGPGFLLAYRDAPSRRSLRQQ